MGGLKKVWPRQTSIKGHFSAVLLLSSGKIHTLSMSSGALKNQPKQKSGRATALPAPPPRCLRRLPKVSPWPTVGQPHSQGPLSSSLERVQERGPWERGCASRFLRWLFDWMK